MPTEAPLLLPETSTNTQLDHTWNVLIHDDPVNLMPYVTKVIMKIFGYSEQKATTLMMEVHTAGCSIVWSGTKEHAEHYVQQVQSAQLYCTMEQAQ